jgi:hypothetical protein
MPAKEIAKLFKEGRLHSGSPEGPIVENPRQALAIRLSYLRKEGKIDEEPKKEKKRYRMADAFREAAANR